VGDVLQDTTTFLEDSGFITVSGSTLGATSFGTRTSDLYLDPLSALRLRKGLEAPASEPTTFGLLETACGCPDTYPLFMKSDDDWVGEAALSHWGEFLVDDDPRQLRGGDEDDKETVLTFVKTALILEKWMNETHQLEMEEVYGVPPGDLQSKKDNAQWLIHGMRELARGFRPEWVRPLTNLGLRLEHGIKEELLPLVQLKGVGRVRARTLFARGIRHPADLRTMPLSTLANLPNFGPRTAASLLAQVGGDPEQEAPQPEASPPAKGKGQATMADFGI
jgi:helicase